MQTLSIKEELFNEIDGMPDNFVKDIINYIAIIKNNNENNELIKQSRILSEDSFSKIWNNKEDSVYDSL